MASARQRSFGADRKVGDGVIGRILLHRVHQNRGVVAEGGEPHLAAHILAQVVGEQLRQEFVSIKAISATRWMDRSIQATETYHTSHGPA